jgi:hypothetical protein
MEFDRAAAVAILLENAIAENGVGSTFTAEGAF